MTMRLYSAGLQVFWAIINVRRAIVSHDASISSVIIRGSTRLRRWTDLRMVPNKVDWSRRHRWRLVGRYQGVRGSTASAGMNRSEAVNRRAQGSRKARAGALPDWSLPPRMLRAQA